ncbi:MAG: DMT family transporter, partial [Dehalococcoidia bacterium]
LVADYMFLRLIRTVDISTAMPLGISLVTLFSVGVGATFLGEDVTLLTFLGAILVISGVYMLSFATRVDVGPRKALALGLRGLALILIIVLLWVTGLTLMRIALRDLDIFTGAAIRTLTITPILLLAVMLGLDKSLLAPGGKGPSPDRLRQEEYPGTTAAEGGPSHRRAQQHVTPAAASPDMPMMEGADTASGEAGPEVKLQDGHGAVPSLGVGQAPGPLRRLGRSKSVLGRLQPLPFLTAGISGIMHFGVGSLLLFFALQRSGAAVTVILLNTSILFVAPLSLLFLRERMSWKGILGIVVTAAGVMLVVL